MHSFEVRGCFKRNEIAKNEIKKTRKSENVYFRGEEDRTQLHLSLARSKEGTERIRGFSPASAVECCRRFFGCTEQCSSVIGAHAATTAQKKARVKYFSRSHRFFLFSARSFYSSRFIARCSDGPRWHKGEERIHNSFSLFRNP